MNERIVCVMLCTNNPNNGDDTRRVCCVEFHVGADSALRLGCVGTEPTCWTSKSLEGVRYVRIGRRTFPILGERDWVGNWCWRAVWVKREIAVRIVHHLRTTKKFEEESGWTKLFEKWRSGEQFEAMDFERRVIGTSEGGTRVAVPTTPVFSPA